MPANIMGVGVIGNGVKRMRVNENDAEKVEKINETVAVFLANQIVTDANGNSLAKVEFDRLNTVAGLLNELFCASLINGDTEWPPPTPRGTNRPFLQRDLMVTKALPKCVFSILGTIRLTPNCRSLSYAALSVAHGRL